MSQYVTGKYFETGRPIRIVVENGKITKIEAWKGRVDNNIWLAPALFDLQVNGYAGVDFQRLDISQQDLIKAVKALQKSGCLKFFLTLITDDWCRLILKLRKLQQIRNNDSLLKAAIAGWHIEGPFLSAKPGFCGTHDASKMLDPTCDHIYKIREVTGSDAVLLTIAPERHGALEAIKTATSAGIKVFLGHTDADQSTLERAIECGAMGFTHLGNGCPQLLERKDNIIWRVLDIKGFPVSLIPDRIHVSPPLFRLIHKVKKSSEICYISDAIAAADSPPGCYTLGEITVNAGQDGTVWNPSKTGFAGSSLRPFDGILRAMEMLDEKWQSVWKRYSELPASLMNINVKIEPGGEANFVTLKQDESGKPMMHKVYFKGKQVFP